MSVTEKKKTEFKDFKAEASLRGNLEVIVGTNLQLLRNIPVLQN